MKIQILNNIADCIDGYNPVFIENNTIDIDTPDNSISSILMTNSIEQISYDYINQFLSKMRQLLRINGKLVITGVDINCLSRDLINKTINVSTYNEIVYNRKGIYDSSELATKLLSLGLQIDKILLKGSTYELHAVRNN